MPHTKDPKAGNQHVDAPRSWARSHHDHLLPGQEEEGGRVLQGHGPYHHGGLQHLFYNDPKTHEAINEILEQEVI